MNGNRFIKAVLPLMTFLFISFFLVSSAWGAGVVSLVSTNSSGLQGNAASQIASVSADGRYVAFTSLATNLVPGDTNARQDIFRKDLLTGTTVLVSTDSSGNQANGDSNVPSISADGNLVAFVSSASNLIPNDSGAQCYTPFGTFHCSSVFLKNLSTGATTLVSADVNGIQAPSAVVPALSADGRYVAFVSGASTLVPGDTNGRADVFLKDTFTGAISLVSTDAAGNQANGNSGTDENINVAVSNDGRFVAFESQATNLVPGDTNGADDVFVKDTTTGAIQRVSADASGIQGNGKSYMPAISSEGRYVAFQSAASNLVPNDNNQNTDIFVKDTITGAISAVDTDAAGNLSYGICSNNPSISADGRYITFLSAAYNLVYNDMNGWGGWDIFVKDTLTGAINMVDVNSQGSQSNSTSMGFPAISADGRTVVFGSAATNLVSNDTNNAEDIFVAATSMPATSGKPALGLDKESVYWQSFADYSIGRLSVDYLIHNTGPNPAFKVAVNALSVTDGVEVASTLPVSLGNLPSGSSHLLGVKFSVPTNVSRFTTSVTASAEDGAGTAWIYP